MKLTQIYTTQINKELDDHRDNGSIDNESRISLQDR